MNKLELNYIFLYLLSTTSYIVNLSEFFFTYRYYTTSNDLYEYLIDIKFLYEEGHQLIINRTKIKIR